MFMAHLLQLLYLIPFPKRAVNICFTNEVTPGNPARYFTGFLQFHPALSMRFCQKFSVTFS